MVDFLQRLFFESVVLLLIVEVVALTIVLAVHRRTRSDASRRVLWGTLVGCAALLVLQQVVTTSREKIVASVEKMVWAVDDGDMAALAEELDRDFEHHHLDRKVFMDDVVNPQLQRYRVDEAGASGFNVEVDGDRATISFRVICTVRRGDRVEGNMLSVWKLGYVRRDDGWRLQRIISTKFGPGMWDLATVLSQ